MTYKEIARALGVSDRSLRRFREGTRMMSEARAGRFLGILERYGIPPPPPSLFATRQDLMARIESGQFAWLRPMPFEIARTYRWYGDFTVDGQPMTAYLGKGTWAQVNRYFEDWVAKAAKRLGGEGYWGRVVELKRVFAGHWQEEPLKKRRKRRRS